MSNENFNMMNLYTMPRGTVVLAEMVADMRYVTIEAGLKDVTDDFLHDQFRVMVWAKKPQLLARQRGDGGWMGWINEDGKPIDPNTGAIAPVGSHWHTRGLAHVQSAQALYEARLVDACPNCRGHAGDGNLSGFWIPSGEKDIAIAFETNSFKRRLMHYPCPVCWHKRQLGDAPIPLWLQRHIKEQPVIDLDSEQF